MQRLLAVRPDDSAARWALRWLQDLPAVSVVLSGMTTLDQIKENVDTFAEPAPLCDSEKALLTEVADSMLNWVPCTACRYCTEGCPQQIAIPRAFSNYNTAVKFGNKTAQLRDYNRSCANLADCVECGQCMDACPQHLEIPELLKKVRAYFED